MTAGASRDATPSRRAQHHWLPRCRGSLGSERGLERQLMASLAPTNGTSATTTSPASPEGNFRNLVATFASPFVCRRDAADGVEVMVYGSHARVLSCMWQWCRGTQFWIRMDKCRNECSCLVLSFVAAGQGSIFARGEGGGDADDWNL